MSFVAPIAIASFFGSIFSGRAATASRRGSRSRSSIRTAAPISRGIVAGAQADTNLQRHHADRRRGARRRAARHGPRSRSSSRKASATRPGRRSSATARSRRSTVLYDPSHTVELAMVRGILTAARDAGGQQRDVRRRAGPRRSSTRRCRRSKQSAMPAEQKRAARRHADSRSQSFYRQPAAPGANAGAARHHACRTRCARKR